jgi:hypothetical protein
VNGPKGALYLDPHHTTHEIYGVDVQKGAIVVFRPDGWVGYSANFGRGGLACIEGYFQEFINW